MIPGLCFAIGAGLVYPFFAIVFGNIIGVFYLKGDDLLNQAHFWALMFVVIAIATLICNFGMNTLFGYASEYMTERVRGLTFAAIMKQDICFFDDRKHSTGILTSNLSSDATKIQGISGMTLGTILSVTVNLTGGAVVALVYGWKLALVALTCLPFLVFCGYFRLRIITYFTDKNKGAYERSAQIACEAVAAIRTVQSLTREKDVMNEYMKILEKPLKDGYKNAWINTILYAISSSANFLVNALVFW